MKECSRRNLLYMGGAAAIAGLGLPRVNGQEFPPPVASRPIYPYEQRAAVSLVRGEERRKIVTEALMAVDREISAALKRKKYVVIKINNVSTNIQLAATHVDALRGIMDYLAPRFKGQVIVA